MKQTFIQQELNSDEKRVVYECLKAAAEGPFFDEWEFQTLFGIERAQIANIAKAWPNIDDDEEDVMVAINNAMGNLVGYPHGMDEHWETYISVSPEEVMEILIKWKKNRK